MNLVLFIWYIFDLIINRWGLKLYSIVGSYLMFLLIVFVVIAIATSLIWKLISNKKLRALFLIVVLLFVSLTVILPFKRGSQIRGFIDSGNKIVDAIELYEKQHNLLPSKLELLVPVYLEKNELEINDATVNYDISYYKVYNELYKNSPYFKSRDRDTYSLTIHSGILGFEFLRYYRDRQEFELTDK